MKTSQKGTIALIGHEGIVPAPYKDSVGIWTFGVGHTAAAGAPYPATMPRGMPEDMESRIREVFTVFAADLISYEDAVNRAVKIPLEQHEFDALVSFHFNTGAIARAEVTRLLNKGDRKGAGKAFMNWKKPPEIISRRSDERHLFETGEYPLSKLSVWNVNEAGKITWRIAKRMTPDEALLLMTSHWSDVLVPAVEEPEDEGFEETDDYGTPLLGRGSKGEAVKYAQSLLSKHGFELTEDGDFGHKTDAATRSFQKANRLSVDGKIGPKTWTVLKSAL